MGSNPCKRLSLLGIPHPVEGSLFQVQGVFRKTTLIRGLFEKKADMWLWYLFCKTCIIILNFNICCIKSDVINSLTIVIHLVRFLVSIDVWAQVVIFTHVWVS